MEDRDVTIHGTDARRWRVLALLGVAQFMLILDVTVVALALPEMGADSTSPGHCSSPPALRRPSTA